MADARPPRIAVITGGRDYTPSEAELAEMERLLEARDIELVVTGGARGVDTIAHERVYGIYATKVMPANWDAHGKAAGPIRNRAMLSLAGVRQLIAFKGGAGTHNCIVTAKKLGIDVWVIGEGRW